MTRRKPRRWIENFTVRVTEDRMHQIAMEQLGFDKYMELRVYYLSDLCLRERMGGIYWPPDQRVYAPSAERDPFATGHQYR